MNKDEIRNKIFTEVFGEVFSKMDAESKAELEKFMLLRSELTKESDRGCVLLAASFIDYRLEQLLRKKMHGNKSHLELLFGISGPVGTFSSRTMLAYSIGLLPQVIYSDIQTIRKIRNMFGHTIDIINFEDQSINDLCKNLRYHIKESENMREVFINCVSGIAGFISSLEKLTIPFTEAQLEDLDKKIEYHKKLAEEIEKRIANEFGTNQE